MEKRILLQELSELLAAREKLTKKKAETFAKAFFEIIESGLDKDKFVKIKGFGTFKLVSVSERESVNVSTGERFQISGHTKISFTPDTELRDLINKPFAHFQTVILNEGTDTAEFDKIDALTQQEEVEDNETEAIVESAASTSEASTPVAIDENVAVAPTEIPADESASNSEEPHEAPAKVEAPTEISEQANEESEAPTPLSATESEEASQTTETSSEAVMEDTPTEAETTTAVETSTEESENNDALHSDVQESDAETFTEDNEMEENNTPIATPHSATNWWKVATLTLLVALLMVISYFTGYFRLFGSCSNMSFNETAAVDTMATDSLKNASEKDSTAFGQSADTINQPDHLPTVDRAQPSVPASPRVASPAPIVKKPAPEAPTPQPAATPAPATEEEPATIEAYSQVPGGKYRIVGTKRSHTLQTGETLRTLALNEYGSKGYAPYIIRHNHLKNPDRVAAGAVILLPELVLAQ